MASSDGAALADRCDDRLSRHGSSVEAVGGRFAQRPVTVHFQPDRVVARGPHAGRLTIDGLLADGTFENQFVTGTSSGSVDAGRDGRRHAWEDRLFGSAYRCLPDGDRPRYGTLDPSSHSDGGTVGFGSCHLVLRPEVNRRSTYCLGDSHELPELVGVDGEMDALVCHLVDEVVRHGTVLGRTLGSDALASLLAALGATSAGPGRIIDGYLEAQVHGGIDIGADVSTLVADDSFLGTRVGDGLEQLAGHAGVPLRWEPGPSLSIDDLPADFELRGEAHDLAALGSLGRAVTAAFADDGRLSARVIGDGARSAVFEPQRWQRWGDPGDVLQLHKQLWKATVVVGER